MPYLLQQLLEISAKQYPDKEAVIYKDNAMTYRDLDAVSNQLAWVLRGAGIEKGDRSELPSWLSSGERVIIIYPQGLESIATCFGCLYAGVVAIPAPALRKQHG